MRPIFRVSAWKKHLSHWQLPDGFNRPVSQRIRGDGHIGSKEPFEARQGPLPLRSRSLNEQLSAWMCPL